MSSKITFKILQLERLGKKQNKFIIRREEKSKTLEISSKVYGPSSLKNCEKFLEKLDLVIPLNNLYRK